MTGNVGTKRLILSSGNDDAMPVASFTEALMPLGFSLDSRHRDIQASFELTGAEIRSFLQLIARSLQIRRHYELFQLVQGEMQDFIPHRILISAWGDFDGAELKIDVISAIPGVRSNRPAGCDLQQLLSALYVRWRAQDRQPLLLHNTLSELLAESNCNCAVHNALHGMTAALVHGNHNARDGSDSLYFALHTGRIAKSDVSIERFRFLADLIVPQLDTAFRKVAAMKRSGEAGTRAALRRNGLSVREEQIIDWVAKGRTNGEISGILSISEFTVKNHMRRIMKKLCASNRTEAVAKFRCDVRDPRTRMHGSGTSPAPANDRA